MSGIVSKVLKMLVFPSFVFFFCGVAHCCSSGFGRFRCFCVSCVCFCLFCLAFVSVLFDLFLVLWLDVVVLFFLCFYFLLFFLFCFFGGFKGHVRWPEGPPHLALNPPYFICFVFLFLFFLFLFCFFVVFCLFFLEGLRVR